MSIELPQQRPESDSGYAYPPFCRSALAAVARNRAVQNANQTPELLKIEVAVASGTICLENLSLTTELL